jgi:hypothetical protein
MKQLKQKKGDNFFRNVGAHTDYTALLSGLCRDKSIIFYSELFGVNLSPGSGIYKLDL